MENRLKIDDPVGAISVHGVNGAWGVIAVGLFADGTYGAGLNGVAGGVRGLFYGGGMGQLTAEIIGAVVCIAFAFTAFHVFFKIVGYLVGNRVPAAMEVEGLDIAEIGIPAYPEFLPAAPSVVTAQPELVPVAASSSVPMLGEGLAVAEANAG
jgi:Amt family ammonium transporter